MADVTAGQTQGPLAGRFSKSFLWAGVALGFGLGGFFDGILLHQVLQWHHLLSGIEEARQDIRVLILADGLFHAAMYVITGIGLVLLWRARQEFAAINADRRLFANALLGFGLWHIVDGVVSHWLLGLHRIRMDVDNPLLWDVLWLVLFGIVPVLGGLLLHRGGGGAHRVVSAPLALVAAIAVAAPWSALPAPGQSSVMVLFRPGVSEAQAFAAIQAINGRLLWSDPSGQLWAIELSTGGDPNQLYGDGVLLISNSIVPAGCLDWVRV